MSSSLPESSDCAHEAVVRAATQTIGDLTVAIRTSTIAPPSQFQPDFLVPKGKDPISFATQLVKGTQSAPARRQVASSVAHQVTDSNSKSTPYPPRALRMLAAVRVWMIVRRFWGYSHQLGEDPDQLLAAFLPRLADARTDAEYAGQVREMAGHMRDGHGRTYFPTFRSEFGGEAPVEVRVIENQFVVSKTLSEAEAEGVARGDVILELDGRPIGEREKTLRGQLTASTAEAVRALCAERLLGGAAATRFKVKLQRADGSKREVELGRSAEFYDRLHPVGAARSFRILEGNLGYVDLSGLDVQDVDAMFDGLARARAIIFDGRGYPKLTAEAIGARLDVKHPAWVAQFRTPLLRSSSLFAEEHVTQFQKLKPSTRPAYANPTVMLIDDVAISQMEHLGLIFEAVAGTTFIGSPTAGANGASTNFAMPGGGSVSFTGEDVRHWDGRQLQQVGLVPDVPARATIAGIRAGRDEVLEKAVDFLKKKLDGRPDGGR